MNKLKTTVIGAFTAAIILAGSIASAAIPFVNINFDSDTVGLSPLTGPISDPLLKPTAIGGYAITTVDEYGDTPPTDESGTVYVGNPAGMSKAAVLLTNPTNIYTGALYLDTLFSHSEQQIALSFDLAVLNVPTVSVTQPKTLNGSGSVGINFGINTFGTGSAGAVNGPRFVSAATSVNGGVFGIRTANNADIQSFFNYTEGETYNVKLVTNYDTGTVATYVDGVSTGSFAFATGPLAAVATQEFFAFINGDLGSANSVAIDNIVAVPEPTTLTALAGGSLLALVRRRRA